MFTFKNFNPEVFAIIFLVAICNQAFGQDSVYLTVSPKWYKTYSLGVPGVSERISIAESKNGDTYLASHQEASNMIYGVLMKHDQQGKLLWTNYIHLKNERINSSTLVSDLNHLSVDSKGNVTVIGIIKANCVFTSTDTISSIELKLVGVENNFIAQYNSDGKLLWVKTFNIRQSQDTPALKINSICKDKKGSLYFCGSRLNVIKVKSSISFDPEIVIGKLNKTGEIEWLRHYNGTGNDRGNSLVVDSKGYLYMAAFFDKPIFVEGDSLKTYKQTSNSFIAKYDNKGNFVWKISPEPIGLVSMNSLAIDKQDQIYVAGEYYQTLKFANSSEKIETVKNRNLFIGSFNSKGDINWLRNCTNELTGHGHIEQLKVGEDGFLYLSGEASGMSILLVDGKKQGIEQYYGKQAKLDEGIIIKYDNVGNALWFRIVSGEGNQDISDFNVNKYSDITISGNFSGNIGFKNHTIDTTGNTFLAHITANSLSDIGPDKEMFAREQEELRRRSIDMNACSCEDYTEEVQGNSNSISLQRRIDYDEFKKTTGFVKVDTVPLFEALFGYNFQADASMFEYGGFYSFDLVAYKPIRFKPAPGAVIIDLTPCELKKGNSRRFEFSMGWEHPLKTHFREFDENEFKGTGKEYYTIALSLSRLGTQGILNNFYGEDESEELQPFYNYLKSKYKTKINLNSDTPLEEQLENTGKGLSLSDEIYNFYLKPMEGPGRKPTSNFESQFQSMFYEGPNGGMTIKAIKDMIHNYYRASLGVKRFKIEFPERLVKSESPWAMFKVEQMHYSTDKGIYFEEEELEQLCMKPFSIGNSGMNITIKNAIPDLSPIDRTFEYLYYLDYKLAREFGTEFIGVYAKQCEVSFIFNDKNINAKGVDFFIGNNEIKGWLELNPVDSISKEDIVKRLIELQFKDVKIIEDKKRWVFSITYN